MSCYGHAGKYDFGERDCGQQIRLLHSRSPQLLAVRNSQGGPQEKGEKREKEA